MLNFITYEKEKVPTSVFTEIPKMFGFWIQWMNEMPFNIQEGARNVISRISQCFLCMSKNNVWGISELQLVSQRICEFFFFKISDSTIQKCLLDFGNDNIEEI